jgi:hypothetical protein
LRRVCRTSKPISAAGTRRSTTGAAV